MKLDLYNIFIRIIFLLETITFAWVCISIVKNFVTIYINNLFEKFSTLINKNFILIFDRENKYYEYIIKLEHFLIEKKVALYYLPYEPIKEKTLGTFYINPNEIFINTNHYLTDKHLFHVLLHETAHWYDLSERENYCSIREETTKQKNEMYAYLYGWYLIKKLGFKIPKSDWILFSYKHDYTDFFKLY